jgi:hypothetical protein
MLTAWQANLGDLTSLAVASTLAQVDITATSHVGAVFLSILTAPFIDCRYRAWTQSATACELNSV